MIQIDKIDRILMRLQHDDDEEAIQQASELSPAELADLGRLAAQLTRVALVAAGRTARTARGATARNPNPLSKAATELLHKAAPRPRALLMSCDPPAAMRELLDRGFVNSHNRLTSLGYVARTAAGLEHDDVEEPQPGKR